MNEIEARCAAQEGGQESAQARPARLARHGDQTPPRCASMKPA
jgi:hypothetical protein